MIRRVGCKHPLQEAFLTKDEWRDLRLPDINGRIRQLDVNSLRSKLSHLRLNASGGRDVLSARLKAHYKKIFLLDARGAKVYKTEHLACRYFVAIDFEATCQEENGQNYPHEIIEFPAVLVDAKTQQTVAKFHSYVRPRINPLLSDFCRKLTGIEQEQVDAAPYFPAVYKSFLEWLIEKGLLDKDGEKTKLADTGWTVVTDGSADICRFLFMQCKHDKIAFPYQWAGKYNNLKKYFQSAYHPKGKMRLEQMLEQLGMEFEGRLHSGIDDAVNIARIVSYMIDDGHGLWQNEEFTGRYQQPLAPPKHIYEDIEEIKLLHNQMAKLAV